MPHQATTWQWPRREPRHIAQAHVTSDQPDTSELLWRRPATCLQIPRQPPLRLNYFLFPSSNRWSIIGVSGGRGIRFKLTISPSTTSSMKPIDNHRNLTLVSLTPGTSRVAFPVSGSQTRTPALMGSGYSLLGLRNRISGAPLALTFKR